MSEELEMITSTSFKTEQLLMVNMLVSIFLLNGAVRCPRQPVHKSPIFISRPFKELGLFCCLFLFVVFIIIIIIQGNHFQPDIRKPNSIHYSGS